MGKKKPKIVKPDILNFSFMRLAENASKMHETPNILYNLIKLSQDFCTTLFTSGIPIRHTAHGLGQSRWILAIFNTRMGNMALNAPPLTQMVTSRAPVSVLITRGRSHGQLLVICNFL